MSDERPSRPPRALGQAIDDVLRRLRGPDRKAASTVFGRWREIVGDTVADHASPARLKDNCLVVDVDDPAWLAQLRFLHDQLVTTLREHTDGAVNSIELRVKRPR